MKDQLQEIAVQFTKIANSLTTLAEQYEPTVLEPISVEGVAFDYDAMGAAVATHLKDILGEIKEKPIRKPRAKKTPEFEIKDGVNKQDTSKPEVIDLDVIDAEVVIVEEHKSVENPTVEPAITFEEPSAPKTELDRKEVIAEFKHLHSRIIQEDNPGLDITAKRDETRATKFAVDILAKVGVTRVSEIDETNLHKLDAALTEYKASH